jgi:hypothetical protein
MWSWSLQALPTASLLTTVQGNVTVSTKSLHLTVPVMVTISNSPEASLMVEVVDE